jgi:hypothetical protein
VSNVCDKCGQDIPEVIAPFNLPQLRAAVADSDITWEDVYANEALRIVGMPADATVVAIAAEAESDWDSYGDAVGTGFVVFAITYGGITKNFKVDGDQDSYSGWTWNERNIAEVNQIPKVVTVWESI